jgi:2-polyprenyl-3-methyl-5-hydroxy-6-metoxy-1,4-benzoquinol methylase
MVYYTPKWLKHFIYFIWRCQRKLKLQLSPNKYYLDPYGKDDEFIYVKPEDIIFATKKSFGIYNFKDRILGGNWDKEVINFENLDFFKSFKKRIYNNLPWGETEYYKRVIKQINNGIFKWSCKNVKEFDKRCEGWDKLFTRIKEEGYKKGWHEDEVSINIGRNGEMIFNNGRHRLTFAKILKIDKIPVKVTVRHKNWVAFKKDILEYSKNYGNKVYEKLTHPDLANIPSVHKGSRFDIIKKHLTAEKGTVLDIGCQWGYFCHKFEESGYDCCCVEKSNLNLYFLGKLRKAENRKFKIIPHSVFDIQSDSTREYDVILALSVFHHFIKKENTYIKLIKLLKKLKGKELFFEPHNPEEPQMHGSYRNFDHKEFAKFIVDNSLFEKFDIIGHSETGRPIYKIY